MTETRAELGCVLGVYAASPSWATSALMRSFSFLSRSPDEALPGGLGCSSGSGHYTLERQPVLPLTSPLPVRGREEGGQAGVSEVRRAGETVKPFDLSYGRECQLTFQGKEGPGEVGRWAWLPPWPLFLPLAEHLRFWAHTSWVKSKQKDSLPLCCSQLCCTPATPCSVSVLKMGKLSPREAEWFIQGHTAG